MGQRWRSPGQALLPALAKRVCCCLPFLRFRRSPDPTQTLPHPQNKPLVKRVVLLALHGLDSTLYQEKRVRRISQPTFLLAGYHAPHLLAGCHATYLLLIRGAGMFGAGIW